MHEYRSRALEWLEGLVDQIETMQDRHPEAEPPFGEVKPHTGAEKGSYISGDRLVVCMVDGSYLTFQVDRFHNGYYAP
jgi:hypothetical protein